MPEPQVIPTSAVSIDAKIHGCQEGQQGRIHGQMPLVNWHQTGLGVGAEVGP